MVHDSLDDSMDQYITQTDRHMYITIQFVSTTVTHVYFTDKQKKKISRNTFIALCYIQKYFYSIILFENVAWISSIMCMKSVLQENVHKFKNQGHIRNEKYLIKYFHHLIQFQTVKEICFLPCLMGVHKHCNQLDS